MARPGRDPLAKRKDETDLQWRSRVARHKETARQQGEDIVTPQRLAKGDLKKGYTPDQARARTYHTKPRSALQAMNRKGSLSDEQYQSALVIARVVERIERSAATSGAGMDERVDCMGSASDCLVEHLHEVRMERAYTEWRESLPTPRRMILDMITRDHRLKAIASRYSMGWPKAQRLLRNALDDWPEYFARQMRRIDQDDLDMAHWRIEKRA